MRPRSNTITTAAQISSLEELYQLEPQQQEKMTSLLNSTTSFFNNIDPTILRQYIENNVAIIAYLKAELATAKSSCIHLTSQNEGLNKQLSQSQEQISKLQQDIIAAQQQQKNLESSLTSIQSNLQTINQEKSRLQSKNQVLQEESKSLQAKITELQSEQNTLLEEKTAAININNQQLPPTGNSDKDIKIDSSDPIITNSSTTATSTTTTTTQTQQPQQPEFPISQKGYNSQPLARRGITLNGIDYRQNVARGSGASKVKAMAMEHDQNERQTQEESFINNHKLSRKQTQDGNWKNRFNHNNTKNSISI